MTIENAPLNDLLRQAIRCHELGELADAEVAYRRVIAVEPAHAHAQYLFGSMLGQLGRYDESIEHLTCAIQSDDSLAEAFIDRANVLRIQKKFDNAELDYQRAIKLEPNNSIAYANLARLYKDLNRTSVAVEHMEKAVLLASGHTHNQIFLAEQLLNMGAVDRTIECYESIIENDPMCVEAINNLGALLKGNGHISRSLEYFRRAVDLNPVVSTGHANLGMALMESGDIEAAEERFRTAVSLDPDDHAANSNLLLCLNYRADIEPEQLFAVHRKYAERLESGCAQPAHEIIDSTPSKRLRIAYVSPDFRCHSVSRFIALVLEAHDRKDFEIFCLANVMQPDEVTERFQEIIGDGWRDISDMSDDQVFSLVRDCKIDILIDLAGYSAGNRLRVFSRKPAPVQMTYLGYPATTGLSRIDYRVTDPVSDPVGKTEAYFSEKLLRLPETFLCFEKPADSLDVTPLPVNCSGRITFGSFNNASKLNQNVLIAWSRILAELPTSRLVLKAWQFNDEGLCRRFRQRFSTLGVSDDRIELSGWLDERSSHLEKYNEIDIGLDTFPYNGTTTTCEALWMGVPVVTLAGGFHASRVGASVLESMGLGELVTESTAQYIACAKALATNISRLTTLRSGLRERLSASVLMKSVQFTRQLEIAFRDAWRAYCEGKNTQTIEIEGEKSAFPNIDEALRLHIGGEQPRVGWKILNAIPGPNVDFVGNCTDLSRFSSNTVDQVYASHVLEHLGYQKELPAALRGIYRVLRPGGIFHVSVPDLEILCGMFLDPKLSDPERFQLMRIIYGGQIDAYDFHKAGLTWPIMRRFLEDNGFVGIERVKELGLFEDTSTLQIGGQAISLNIVARK